MADWFSKLSPAQKRDYLKKHPNSKYRKKPSNSKSAIKARESRSKKAKESIQKAKISLRNHNRKEKVLKLHDAVDKLSKMFKDAKHSIQQKKTKRTSVPSVGKR